MDADGQVHAGKIMQYNVADGHRVKHESKVDVSWVHSTMGIKDFVLKQCYFGEHTNGGLYKPPFILRLYPSDFISHNSQSVSIFEKISLYCSAERFMMPVS